MAIPSSSSTTNSLGWAEETDPLGRKIKYQYHHLTTLVDYRDGSIWKARYDAKGNLIAEVDALGNKTEYLNSDDGFRVSISMMRRGGTTILFGMILPRQKKLRV
jgi:YD repeat-containing protein